MSFESIDNYKDYTYIMYILCDKTSSFYGKIKNAINVPIVICSTTLSILHTTEVNDNTDTLYIINYVSIACNLFIAISLSILNLFKITEKEFSFKMHAANFLKLHNKINTEIAKKNTFMIEIDIMQMINEYNLLCEFISFHIPSRIKLDIQKNYPNYKYPVLLSNNKYSKKKSTLLSYYYNIWQHPQQSPDSLELDDASSAFRTSRPGGPCGPCGPCAYINEIFEINMDRLSPINSSGYSTPFSNNSPIRAICTPLKPFQQSSFQHSFIHCIEKDDITPQNSRVVFNTVKHNLG